MLAVTYVLYQALNLYWWIVIASAILSWLYAFNIVNPGNPFVDSVGRFLWQLTEPVYRRIRKVLPDLGGIDLSPLVVLFGIMFLQYLLVYYVNPAIYSVGV
ncbi:YggT family protein [Aurantimonas sp. C2-6-R+9]|uniref:YggT family protein n=1 Tax=unclassified Aurantimonas TaxID=2638230 RepID=UPI002E17A4C1|nr:MULTISPECIES: YggT family protein [unclassified Aurantimonas]MEC5289753.1 YggT family protein [Aurantimonas sp. C2-3-R2]MEC5322320.1 YggT family protein [Aurantimonas sp. A3-2-R12]MEC5379720.1 YggT family protein [Aurantimonas sp. C2-6-R+9]MEC5410809.1 YggT family protein [Aurantimonas sp. C2-4-R8]